MIAKKNLLLHFVLSLIIFGIGAVIAMGCVGQSTHPVHVFNFHPDLPLKYFINGRLGIIQPTYARVYLFCAYRWLAQTPLTKAEQAVVAERLCARLNVFNYEPTELDKAAQTWREMRYLVSGAPSINNPIDCYTHKSLPPSKDGVEFRNYFLNINQDAFATARATLDDLIKRFGANGREVVEWLKAQDQVFSSRPGIESLPANPGGDWPPLLAAHRRYQVACARFYSGRYDRADALFAQIADDRESPWRDIAPYLRARALIRHATVDSPEGSTDEASLLAAEKLLKEIIAAPAAVNLHAACRRLLGYLYGQLQPQARMIELGRKLQQPGEKKDFRQDLEDYLLFFDRTDRYFVGMPTPNISMDAVCLADDLSDWIMTMKWGEAKVASAHAWEKYQKQASLPWLVAALTRAEAADNAMIVAGEKIVPESPAYLTVAFHLARLRGGEYGRNLLTAALQHADCAVLPSTRNRLRLERARLATGWADFLAYSDGAPAGIVDYNMEEIELPGSESNADLVAGEFAPLPVAMFHEAREFMDQLSIDQSASLIMNPPVPAFPGATLVYQTCSWAICQERYDIADRLVPLLIKANPKPLKAFTAYLEARDPVAKKFYAALAMLRSECSAKFNYAKYNGPGTGMSFREKPLAELEAAERIPYAEELKKLKLLHPSDESFYFQAVQARFEQEPADPDIPEALHRIVKGYYGEFAKKAFTLLHNNFPRSPWAKKTKYWH